MTALAWRPVDWRLYLGPLRLGLSIVGVAQFALLLGFGGPGYDTYAYWLAGQSAAPYAIFADFGAYHYTPALIPLLAPLSLVGWPTAYLLWAIVLTACLVYLGRSWALALLAFPPVASELFHGNVHLLIAVAIVAGFRRPVAWAFPLLTKITPGVGVLWFAARHEWRSFTIALAATAVVVAVSMTLSPSFWLEWVQHTLATASVPDWHDWPNEIPIALALRLPVAIAVTVLAAHTNRRWLVPVAVTLATPHLWFHALSVLAAVPILWSTRRTA